MSKYLEKNLMKLRKVVYLLLQKYHQSMGLAVIGWCKEPDNHYFSLYSLAVRDKDGNPKYLKASAKPYKLTTYQENSIGFPAWGFGEQIELSEANKREFRSKELMKYMEEHLTLSELADNHKKEILDWQKNTTVEQAERFLLSWNILGMLSTETKCSIYTYRRSEYEYPDKPPTDKVMNKLGWPRPDEMLHICGDIKICNNGKAVLPDDSVMDLYILHIEGGYDAKRLVKMVIEHAEHSKKNL